MDAMASRRASPADDIPVRSRLAGLWQWPLLLISLGLFAYAAWLFIDPKPAPTVDDRITAGRKLLEQDRPEAAIDHLRKLLAEKAPAEQEAQIYLLLAESTAAAQKQQKANVPGNHALIIDYTKKAMARGVKADLPMHRRLAESYEALGRSKEALDHYRQAISLDADRALPLQRKIIDLQLAAGDIAAAEHGLAAYLKDQRLSDSEKAWALGERSQLLADAGNFNEARDLLDQALRMSDEPLVRGQIHYRLGYCAWKLGEPKDAERLLRVARDQLKAQHPCDADAAVLLGRILQDRGEHREAMSFFQDVLVSHPDAAVAPLARLGRGVCRIESGDDLPGLQDLQDLVREIGAKPSREKHKPDAIRGLQDASRAMTKRGNYQGAMEAMAMEQTLQPKPEAEFFARLAEIYEKRASQVEQTVPAATEQAEKVRREQQSREMLTRAGDAAIAHGRALTMSDDQGHGRALWKGIDLYDRAGNLAHAIGALELFIAERPDDPLASEALLRLGRAYQAAGQFDKAVAAFQRNQFRYPQSLAASKSGVPLAQALIAQGPQSYAKAEAALQRTLESQVITPEAEEFRNALFELAQLYYRTSRYEQAVARLEEIMQRYPKEPRAGQIQFLMADSYRKSAGLLKDRVRPAAPLAASATASADGDAAPANVASQLAAQAQAAAARRERLKRAGELYDRVIEHFRAAPPTRDLDKLYVKLSHFYRADCLYDNGSYEEAIRLYDAAALRYQDDPASLAAYVQIVNAYCALGKFDQAKAANERAKWLLRRMPADAFKDDAFAMPRQYWDDWLRWTASAGMW